MTTITAMPKGIKVKLPGNYEGEGELNRKTPSVYRLSNRRIRNVFRTVWFVNLKLTGLVAGDV